MNGLTQPGKRRALVYLDASGASMSTLCAIHCALTPMLATLFPLIGLSVLAGEGTEAVLLVLSASLGITSLCLGYRLHQSRKAVVVLILGLSLLGSGRVVEGWNFERAGLTLIVGGGLVVAGSHLLNRRLCRLTRCEPRNARKPRETG